MVERVFRRASDYQDRQQQAAHFADHVDAITPAPRTAPAQPRQRDIATAGLDQGGEIGVGLVAAVPARQ